MSTAETSAISALLSDLLAEITDCNNYINSKTWFFAGKSTYWIIHGKNKNTGLMYSDTYDVNYKYDQLDADTITKEMFYDPRYKVDFVKQYNTNYNSYCIACKNRDGSATYYLIDLDTAFSDISAALNGTSSEDTKWKAIETYAAAKAMGKISILVSHGLDETALNTWYNKNSEVKKAVDVDVQSLKLSKFGLDSVNDKFVYYKASVDEKDLWYVTENDLKVMNSMIKEYKEAYDKLFKIAYEAASSGGTIVNCINNAANNTISGNDYSYINISQIMVCMASDTDITASTNDDLDSYFNSIVEELSKEASKEKSIKVIVISVIICIAIFTLFLVYVIGMKVYANYKISKHAVDNGNVSIGDE